MVTVLQKPQLPNLSLPKHPAQVSTNKMLQNKRATKANVRFRSRNVGVRQRFTLYFVHTYGPTIHVKLCERINVSDTSRKLPLKIVKS